MDFRSLRVAAENRLSVVRPRPIKTKPVEWSLLAPVEAPPSDRLLDVALRAVEGARSLDLSWLASRVEVGNPSQWPGEHYALLTALVTVLRPKTVVEIGTATGLSALAIKAGLPEDGKIVSFDLIPWREFPVIPGVGGVALRDEDFADGRLEQRLDDVSTEAGARANADILRSADFVFVDAKHDGEQERRFLCTFDEVGLAHGPIVMYDDIRLWKMLAFWREIARPKLDLTSFGHWSGTGLVDYA